MPGDDIRRNHPTALGGWDRLPPAPKRPTLARACFALGLFICAHVVVAFPLHPALLWAICQHTYVVCITLCPAVAGFLLSWWLSLRAFRWLRRKHRPFLSYRSARTLVVMVIIVHVIEFGWVTQAVVRVVTWDGDIHSSVIRMCSPKFYYRTGGR